MPDRLVRERLLEEMRPRHRLAVVALESPAGFGRTVLLEHALQEGPVDARDLDIFYRCGPDDADLAHLVAALIATCGAGLSPEGGPPTGEGSDEVAQVARAIVTALAGAGPPGSQVALVVDNVERTGAAGDALWPLVVERLPPHVHLVLSGRRLPPIELARHLAAGTGRLIDSVDLAFTPEELSGMDGSGERLAGVDRELASWPALASLMSQGRSAMVADFLRETVLLDADPVVGRALAAVATVGGCPSEVLGTVVGSVVGDGTTPTGTTPTGAATTGAATTGAATDSGSAATGTATDSAKTSDADLADVLRQLTRMPLVRARGGGCWPHPVWAVATASVLTPEERNRVIVAGARSQVAAGMITVAGHLAIRTGNHEALAAVVRGALATLPPNASMADLTSWVGSGLLPADSVERTWLEAVVDLQLGDVSGTARDRLESARQSFEGSGDVAGETSVIVTLGNLARGRSDVVELSRLLARADVLATQGNATARGLAALGHAVGRQLANDPEAALRALDDVPPGSLVGEWATQYMMIRGTNLLLAGRSRAAIRALEGATGEGSDASRGVAHDLLAAARWYSGDQVGALADAAAAEALALRSGTPTFLQLARASRACLLAATNQTTLAGRLVDQLRHGDFGAGSGEADALTHVAEALLMIEAGDLSGARSTLRDTEAPSRTVRSAVWKAALQTGLGDGIAASDPSAAPNLFFERAVAAGRAAAEHIGGGELPGDQYRPFLPAAWSAGTAGSLSIALNGSGRLERDFRLVEHPAWGRARVRELCLHLALVTDRSRSGVAAALWPDRDDKAAGSNLRVTLTHLLDVIDPERTGIGDRALIVDANGSLCFSRTAGIRVDLWDIERHARAILAIPAHERPSLLAHARRLIDNAPGPPLGGLVTGEWLEPHRRRLDELVITASLHAGGHALAAGAHDLANDLGQRALTVDPWSEPAHRLVIESRLRADDFAGARRALLHTVAVLDDLGVPMDPTTVELAYRVGLGDQVGTNRWPGLTRVLGVEPAATWQ